MEYRRLGNSGLQVSVIGLGTNNFGPRIDYPAAERVLRQAVDAGINFIETSNTYGDRQAKAFIGKALRGHRAQVLTRTDHRQRQGGGLAPLSRRDARARRHSASAGPYVGHPNGTPAALPAVVGQFCSENPRRRTMRHTAEGRKP